LEWGVFGAEVNFEDTNDQEQLVNRNAHIHGFWVAGDIVPDDDIDYLAALNATATYEGDAIGQVTTDLFAKPGETAPSQQTYTARGDMEMSWNFRDRSGDMTISKFDQQHFGEDGLTFRGDMCAPGQATCGDKPWSTPSGNHFGGRLSGQLDVNGQNGQLPPDARQLNGWAVGSFVRGPNNFTNNDPKNGTPIAGSTPQGVMGNWTVGTGPNAEPGSRYEASGVFGGRAVNR
jgi:hypothetical protein